MKYLRSFEKLDEVLNYAYDHQYRGVTTNELISFLQLTREGIFSTRDVKSILNTLVKARHINITDTDTYKINLEGCVFVENGGYSGNRKDKYTKRRYMQVARRYGDESAFIAPWFLALIGFGIVCILFYLAYNYLDWKNPF